MQYVGQTHQLLSMRMNSHKFNNRNMDDPSFSTNVAIHFNSNEHSMEDFNLFRLTKFLVKCKDYSKRDTLYPKGLNAKVLYKS